MVSKPKSVHIIFCVAISIDSSFSTQNENNFIDLILYGSDKFDDKKNYNILMCTIKFIKGSQRFDKNLL